MWDYIPKDEAAMMSAVFAAEDMRARREAEGNEKTEIKTALDQSHIRKPQSSGMVPRSERGKPRRDKYGNLL